MSGFDAAQARLDYSAHFGPADGDDWWHDAAIQEYWDELAAKYAADRPEDILDLGGMSLLVQRAANLAWIEASDDAKRGLADELLEIIRAYGAQNAHVINAMCIKRGEQDRRNRGDW